MTGPRESGWGQDVHFPTGAFPIAEVDVALSVLAANALFRDTFGPFIPPDGETLRSCFVDPAEAELLASDAAEAISRCRAVTRVVRMLTPVEAGEGRPAKNSKRASTKPFRRAGPDTEHRIWTVTVSPNPTSQSSSVEDTVPASRTALLTFHPAPTSWELSARTDAIKRIPEPHSALRGRASRNDVSPLETASDPWLMFLEQMPAIGWIRDADNRYVYVNPAYCQRYDITPSDRLGKTPFEVWPREVAARFQENDRLVLARGLPLTFVESAPDPDGTPKVWFNTKFPITDPQGNHFLAGLGVNATHYTHAQQKQWRESVAREVAEVRAEVEEQSRLIHLQSLTNLSMLVAGAVHDFNNHVAAVTLFATLVRENSGNPKLVETYSRQIEQASAAASQLCQQLMNARSPDRPIGFRHVDVAALVRYHEPLMRSIVRSPLALELDLPESAPHVLGDPVQLRQVLVNLVLNGAEACQGAGRIQVRVRVDRGTLHGSAQDENVLSLEVVDNGAGISDSTRKRLFEPFFTTKPGGHGIGLSAAAAIAARHCARLELVPGDEGGTIARLLLPLEASTSVPQRTP
jgi:signal transduction histidine kinase